MRSPSGGEARRRDVTHVRQSSAVARNDDFRLDERAGFRGRSIRQDYRPRLCRTLRPAPQAGCFVSRLKLSKDSAQITLRHRAFRTVAVAPSSASAKWPFLSVTQLRPAVGPLCRRAKNRLRRSLRDSPRGGHPDADQKRETLLSW